jgi:diguanylate cyclase (GGDEF)-like protein
MLSALNLLLITTALSVVMLLVLSSLISSNVKGIREWSVANAVAVAGLLLFAGRGVIPDVLSIEVANALFLSASTIMFVGFRRHLSRSVPVKTLAGGAFVVMAVIVAFHYGVDSVPLRTVAVSIFHGTLCFALAHTIYRAISPTRSRYPYLFTASAAIMLALGHGVRALVYAVQANASISFLEPTPYNLVFFSLGTLALPTLTLGAVMMANAEIIAEATYAADHDHLTGAWSRRAFFNFAEREHARAARHRTDLSLLMFDVDHFKKINDSYGHAIGDQVLVDIVLAAETVIREIDFCARLGGEEFAVLLPDAGGETAAMVAERLRAALERSLNIGPSKIQVSYSVSIGIATRDEDESIASLLSRADMALYSAKAAGRNQAVFAPPPGAAASSASNAATPSGLLNR